MSAFVSDAQKIGALREHPLFATLSEAHLETLGKLAEPAVAEAGETLITEGDPAGDVYLVLAGRLSASVMRTDGAASVVGEIGPGEVVGEMSVLSDLPRSASVTAIRDTTLLRLPRQRFHEFIAADASSLLAMSTLLVRRLEATNRAIGRPPALRTFAVIPNGDGDAVRLARALADEFGSVRVEIVDRSRVDRDLAPDVADSTPGTPQARRLAAYLHDLELRSELVLFVADPDPTQWTARTIRQADRILLLAAGPVRGHSATEAGLLFGPRRPRAPVDLVLAPVDRRRPSAGDWLRDRPVNRHHHVDVSDTSEVRRLVRRLTGRGVGVVLSGGGARGFAHVGVVRALQEAGLEVDIWGGASFGASLAAQFAAGWSIERITEQMIRGTVEVGTLLDVTFPYISLAKGRTLTASITDTFGERLIEDLRTEFYCVSSDLTAGRLRVHDRGPVAHAVRASVAIPGVFPPVRSPEGHVLVDGGIMDNLPVAEMRARVDGGRVIAVDLRSRSDLPAGDLPPGGEASGWQPLLRRVNPTKERMDVPRIIDLLIRSTELASGDRHDTADVTLRPPVEGFGLLEFTAYEPIIDAGYRYASRLIEKDGLDQFESVG